MAKKRTRLQTVEALAVRTIRKGERFLLSLPARKNVAGYKVGGVFHPIRWDPDYDPEEVGEPTYSTTHSGLPGKSGKKTRKKTKRR
jgi:hypothetical protein